MAQLLAQVPPTAISDWALLGIQGPQAMNYYSNPLNANLVPLFRLFMKYLWQPAMSKALCSWGWVHEVQVQRPGVVFQLLVTRQSLPLSGPVFTSVNWACIVLSSLDGTYGCIKITFRNHTEPSDLQLSTPPSSPSSPALRNTPASLQ